MTFVHSQRISNGLPSTSLAQRDNPGGKMEARREGNGQGRALAAGWSNVARTYVCCMGLNRERRAVKARPGRSREARLTVPVSVPGLACAGTTYVGCAKGRGVVIGK